MSVELSTAQTLKELYPQSATALSRYVDILGTRGIEWGLLGPREGDKLWSRHVSNSLALVDVIGSGLDVADIGSGAGLPGIPLAIVRPDLQVTLVESLQRRVNFLELAVDELGLAERVRVLHGRAEEVEDTFDVVTARAVAPLAKLIRWTKPLFSRGELLALKGSSAEREIVDAQRELRRHHLSAHIVEVRAAPGLEGTRVIRVAR